MITKEPELRSVRRRARESTNLTNLAIDIVRDDPEKMDARLVRRWIAQVRGDEDLLDDCLREGGNRAIAVARSFIAREQDSEEKKKHADVVAVKQHKRRKKVAGALAKAAAEARDTLFNLVAENGKKIRDLTGDELDKLESDNAARAGLYRELRKQVKGDQVVGEVLDDEHFQRIADRIGNVKELIELFS